MLFRVRAWRIRRRIKRYRLFAVSTRQDQRERGRTMESVQQQFLESVKPMHDCYVDPSRNHADLVIPNNRPNLEVLRTLEARLRAVL